MSPNCENRRVASAAIASAGASFVLRAKARRRSRGGSPPTQPAAARRCRASAASWSSPSVPEPALPCPAHARLAMRHAARRLARSAYQRERQPRSGRKRERQIASSTARPRRTTASWPNRVSVKSVHGIACEQSAFQERPARSKASSRNQAAPEARASARLIQPTARKRLRKMPGVQRQVRNAGSPTKNENKNKPANVAVAAKWTARAITRRSVNGCSGLRAGSLPAHLEAEAAFRRMRVHGVHAPVDLVAARAQRLERDPHQAAVRRVDPRPLVDPCPSGIA